MDNTTKSDLIKKQRKSNNNFGPRFTRKEKDILYTLFRQYEHIIDIKYRKNSGNKKTGVREYWEKIVNSYNLNPQITTQRNFKQIHKFWLNSRLRKQFPPKLQQQQEQYEDQQTIDDSCSIIKAEPEIVIPIETIEHVTFSNNNNNNSTTAASVGINDDGHLEEGNVDEDDNEDDDDDDVDADDEGNEAAQELLTDCSIEQISPEKLSLNDLLRFKNTSTATAETASTISTTTTSNIINGPNTTTFTETLYLDSHKNEQFTQTPSQAAAAAATTTIIEDSYPISMTTAYPITASIQQSRGQQQLLEQQQQQYANQNYRKMSINPLSTKWTTTTTATTLEDKMNYFKLKEAELKYQEGQLRLEKIKIDLEKSKEELKYMKQVNNIQIEEMKIKLKFLQQQNDKKNKFK